MVEVAPVTSFIKRQRLQWLGNIMRKEENNISKSITEYKSLGIRPRGRPRKRWIHIVSGVFMGG